MKERIKHYVIALAGTAALLFVATIVAKLYWYVIKFAWSLL